MIIREGIEVTKITLDGYELPIPEGYSEFLLRVGGLVRKFMLKIEMSFLLWKGKNGDVK